ncbi:MAG: hypothetical protein DSY55_00120 [Clostridia bacterium]|nr:MAG: hypothetical protein DSY55_00120 [Clostridia bacterium]
MSQTRSILNKNNTFFTRLTTITIPIDTGRLIKLHRTGNNITAELRNNRASRLNNATRYLDLSQNRRHRILKTTINKIIPCLLFRLSRDLHQQFITIDIANSPIQQRFGLSAGSICKRILKFRDDNTISSNTQRYPIIAKALPCIIRKLTGTININEEFLTAFM